jgi:hypothetical protein
LGDDANRLSRRAEATGHEGFARAADYLRAPPAEVLGQTFFARRIRFLVRRIDPELATLLLNFP